MRFDNNYGSDPNYVGSSLQPTQFYTSEKNVKPSAVSQVTEHEKWVGEVLSYTSHTTDEDFVQPAALWEVIGRDEGHQDRVIGNLAASIKSVDSVDLRKKVYGMPLLFYSSVISSLNLVFLLFLEVR